MLVARTLVALLALVLFTGCAISEQKEIAIGQQSFAQFEQEFGGLYPDEQVQEYVSDVGMSLVRFAGRQDLPWQFRVIDSEQINAFALPGGFVYITSGLLFQLENESQLASILGHEIGHVVERHSVRQIQRAQGAQFVPLLAGLFGGGLAGDIAGAVTQLGLMRYSRDQERDADFAGLEYMTRGGYDADGIVEAMRIMQRAGGGGGGGPPEFLSTHPNPGNRIEYLTEAAERRDAQTAGERIVGEDGFRRIVLSRAPAGRQRR